MKFFKAKFILASLVCINVCLVGCQNTKPQLASSGEVPLERKEYDKNLVSMISESWFNILKNEKTPSPEKNQPNPSKVVAQFTLFSDGNVKNLRVVKSYVGETLTTACLMAITNSSPFPKWPDEMLYLLKTNNCEITFTFDYYNH